MIVDIIVGAVLLVSAIIAFIRGMIREVLTIFGVLGGLISSYLFGDLASDFVERWITPEPGNFKLEEQEPARLFDLIPYPVAADMLAYGAIFIIVVGVLSVISHFLSEGLRKLGLGPVDRTLGVIFGLARGILLLGLLYLPVFMLVDGETKTRWFEGSRSYIYLEKTAGIISGFLPQPDTPPGEQPLEQESKAIEDIFKTRQTLQELKVLKGPANNDTPAGAAEKTSPAGYGDDFRQNMDKLFEEENARPVNE